MESISKPMTLATITKNGMINLPVEIRKKFNLKQGDKIKFVEFEDGIMVIPIKKLEELVNPDNLEIAIKMAKEIAEGRKRDVPLGR